MDCLLGQAVARLHLQPAQYAQKYLHDSDLGVLSLAIQAVRILQKIFINSDLMA